MGSGGGSSGLAAGKPRMVTGGTEKQNAYASDIRNQAVEKLKADHSQELYSWGEPDDAPEYLKLVPAGISVIQNETDANLILSAKEKIASYGEFTKWASRIYDNPNREVRIFQAKPGTLMYKVIEAMRKKRRTM